MDVNVHQGLARALQSMVLPPADARFDDLLARLDAVGLPRRAVVAAIAPAALHRLPARPRHGLHSRWLPDRRAIARTLQRKAARRASSGAASGWVSSHP